VLPYGIPTVVMAYRRPSSLPIIKPRFIDTGLAAN
jgi:hypothetical protein